jgi:hypothetical protein
MLFATGNDAGIFARNLKQLGVDLTRLDAVVISQRHGDHTTGLEVVVAANPTVPIYAPQELAFFKGGLPKEFLADDASLPARMRYFDGKDPDVLRSGTPWPQANFQIVTGTKEILRQHPCQRLGHVVTRECAASRQHLEQDAPKCPDVGSLVRRAALGLLRRHICRRAQNEADRGHRRRRDRRRLCRLGRSAGRLHGFRKAEVEDFGLTISRHRDVGGLEIAMDDAFVVRRFQRFRNLYGNRECFANRDRPARDTPRQVLSGDQLHGEGMDVARLLKSEDLCDVRVIERGEGLRFALESGNPVRVRRKRLGQDFDRHVAIEARIAGLVYLAHPSGPKGGDHFIGAEAHAESQGQRRGLYGACEG